MEKKIIIFDLDGVLFDTEALSQEHLASLYPGLTPHMQRELLTENFHEGLRKHAHWRITETEEEETERKRWYVQRKAEAGMFPGAKETLQALHQDGYTLVLNTSATDHNTLPILEHTQITTLFDFVATADLSTSKFDKFFLIEKRYDAKNEDSLFITDTLGDLREADLAGVPTVCVTWGAHDRSFFTREAHTNLVAIVDSFEELMEAIHSRGIANSKN